MADFLDNGPEIGPEIRKRFQKSYFRNFCRDVLKTGPIPRHVAIIMDGNRRFARKMHLSKVAEGHAIGFEKLAESLEWCYDVGIREVTVYAFSIENFKRSKEEVDGLMELAKQKFTELLEERELIQKHEVCVRILGDLELLPRDVQEIVAKTMNMSRNNRRAVLNVCFAYTSRCEMAHGVKQLAWGVEEGLIKPTDITESLLEQCFYTNKSSDPDLLIRTSGEVRLSDFLLWQSSFSCISFLKTLWPEFSVWDLYFAILTYQRNYSELEVLKRAHQEKLWKQQQHMDVKCAVEQVTLRHKGDKEVQASEGFVPSAQTETAKYASEREARCKQFIEALMQKEQSFLDNLSPPVE